MSHRFCPNGSVWCVCARVRRCFHYVNCDSNIFTMTATATISCNCDLSRRFFFLSRAQFASFCTQTQTSNTHNSHWILLCLRARSPQCSPNCHHIDANARNMHRASYMYAFYFGVRSRRSPCCCSRMFMVLKRKLTLGFAFLSFFLSLPWRIFSFFTNACTPATWYIYSWLFLYIITYVNEVFRCLVFRAMSQVSETFNERNKKINHTCSRWLHTQLAISNK